MRLKCNALRLGWWQVLRRFLELTRRSGEGRSPFQSLLFVQCIEQARPQAEEEVEVVAIGRARAGAGAWDAHERSLNLTSSP